jgi:hypothetical protein
MPLREIHAGTPERVGPVRSRMKGLAYGVYPNLSFLWSNAAFKVSHPRGPGKVEYWSWSIVPADAPDHLKKLLRNNHASFFGPGGIVDFADDRPFFYGLGLGEEKPHPDLPGMVSTCANEHYARAFYERWRDDLRAVEDEA